MVDSSLIDPLERTLVLHDRTWFGHIIQGHPDVTDFRNLVEAAVRTPDQIRFSRIDADCRLYFGRGPRPSVTVMVVADVVRGVVKTAHLCAKASGGAVEWSK